MRDIFIFLFGALATKMIEDNLPDLNLAKGFKKYVAPLLFTLYIALLYKAMQFTKNPDTKRSLQNTFIVLTTAIILTHVMMEANKKRIA
jgi:hypothetical protein